MLPELRRYQVGAMEEARELMRRKQRRLVLYSPTGSGKTILGAAFAIAAMSKGKRVVFVANRVTLIGQASQRFSEMGIEHGILQAKNTRHLDRKCLVASIQTIQARGMPDDVDLIVIDEAHGVPGSKAYRNLIFKHNHIPIIGLTATPFARGMAKRYPELLDEPLFEGMVVAATIRELIELGFLVDCDIYAPQNEPDLSAVPTKKNEFGEVDYIEEELAKAVDKPTLVGDLVEHWLRVSLGRPTVVFATTIAHSKHIVETFNAHGIQADHIDGYMSEDEREAVLGRMLRGEIKVISNVAVLREGWDFPACEVMVLARPTKSLIAWIQMAGRVLRPAPGKTRALILDHSGSSHVLGYPTDDLPLTLCDGSPRTSSGAKKEEPQAKKCPSCGFMKRPRQHKCPMCGFAPERQPQEVEVVAGELSLKERASSKSARFEKQEAWSMLCHIATERGYSDGWKAHKYRTLFGVWPRGLHDAPAYPSDEMRRWILGQNIRYSMGMKKAEERRAAGA